MNDAPPHELVRVRVTVTGRVQGVGFRQFVQSRGREHGLAGWVRNLRSGAVELCAEGPPDVVRRLMDEVRRGPPAADVTSARERSESERSALPMPFRVVRE